MIIRGNVYIYSSASGIHDRTSNGRFDDHIGENDIFNFERNKMVDSVKLFYGGDERS